MANITSDDVRHLATLSALALTDDEIDGLRANLADILSYIEQLGQLDTSEVEPSYQVTGLKNIFRDDTVDEGVISGPELVKSLAPDSHNNQIKVPKVL